MERYADVMFSGGDASYFITVLQEWHTTEMNADRVTVEAALAQMSGPARAWAASNLPPVMLTDAREFFTALAAKWPPKSALTCPDLLAMTQGPSQSINDFINCISYRCDHIYMYAESHRKGHYLNNSSSGIFLTF